MAISGGTYVIVQHASHLHDHGFEVTLAVQEPFTSETLRWHDRVGRLRCVPIAEARTEQFDLVVATWWKTALELHEFEASAYGYFVQSIESRFYPEHELPLRALVDSTYRLPVSYVTEATWIREHLASLYGHNVTLVRNGIRKDLYTPEGTCKAQRNSSSSPRVLIEGHFGVPFKNTALGLRLAREAGAEDIWVLTGSPVKWLPGVSRVFSQVPMSQTPEIYRSCDILIKLSTVEGMFGPPLEIFHCGGTAIVFDVSGHDEYIVDGHNAYVVQRGDTDGVVTKLRRLLSDRNELRRLQAGAVSTADAWISWDESSAKFREWVEGCMASQEADRAAVAALNNDAFAVYARDEKLHQASKPSLTRQRLSKIVAHLPAPVKRMIKRWEAVGEAYFGPREAR